MRFKRANSDVFDISSDSVTDLQDAMQLEFEENKLHLLDSYHSYRSYYYEKALAKALDEHSYCFLLNPKLTTQSESIGKALKTLLPFYRVEKAPTNCNYLVRKIRTNYTQCVHRIRLRPVKKPEAVQDLEIVDPSKFVPDPLRKHGKSGPELFDDYVPSLLESEIAEQKPQDTPPPPPVVSLPLAFGPPAAVPPVPLPPTPVPQHPIARVLPNPPPVIPGVIQPQDRRPRVPQMENIPEEEPQDPSRTFEDQNETTIPEIYNEPR